MTAGINRIDWMARWLCLRGLAGVGILVRGATTQMDEILAVTPQADQDNTRI